MEMLTQAGHWSWKMSIISYIFHLSVIHIIAFLAADCSPAFHFLFQGTEQLFISTFHSVFFTVSLLPSQINTACFRTSLFSSLIFTVLPVSTVSHIRKWPFWSLKCHLKSHFSRSTNFNHLLNNKIWSKAHWSLWEPFH